MKSVCGFDKGQNTKYFEGEDDTMKPIRAKDILTRMIEARPDGESYAEFSTRIGLPRAITTEGLNNRRDVTSGLMYRIAKAFGYQILFYNPNPPDGLEKIYTVGEKKSPIKPRDKSDEVKVIRDSYTGEKFRYVRKYKKKKKKVKLVRIG